MTNRTFHLSASQHVGANRVRLDVTHLRVFVTTTVSTCTCSIWPSYLSHCTIKYRKHFAHASRLCSKKTNKQTSVCCCHGDKQTRFAEQRKPTQLWTDELWTTWTENTTQTQEKVWLMDDKAENVSHRANRQVQRYRDEKSSSHLGNLLQFVLTSLVTTLTQLLEQH